MFIAGRGWHCCVRRHRNVTPPASGPVWSKAEWWTLHSNSSNFAAAWASNLKLLLCRAGKGQGLEILQFGMEEDAKEALEPMFSGSKHKTKLSANNPKDRLGSALLLWS